MSLTVRNEYTNAWANFLTRRLQWVLKLDRGARNRWFLCEVIQMACKSHYMEGFGLQLVAKHEYLRVIVQNVFQMLRYGLT